MEVSYLRRPFKIAKDDKNFKGVVACNLKDLKEKSLTSLNLSSTVDHLNVYLCEDNTLIDDEDYFSFCAADTKFIVRENCGERENDQVDGIQTDGMLERSESLERPRRGHISQDVYRKLKSMDISNSIMVFSSLSYEDLDFISDLNPTDLAKELDISEDIADIYVDYSIKELSKRTQISDATQLLHLFKKSHHGENDTKRKKPMPNNAI